MALINANALAVYYIDGGSTSPLDVQVVTSLNGEDVETSDGAIDLFVTSADVFLGAGTTDGTDGDAGDVSESAFTLAAAATSSTLDFSNSLEEVVSRDGAGASTKNIVSSAQDWSVSADGLLQDTGDTAVALTDLARDGKYVIVKFATGTASGSVQYVGQALLESASMTGGVDEIATYSVSLSGHGKLYKYTVS